ncbi:putative metalloprotease [Hortaea werneckii]|nr:putative metalloprotease [Hortaea werneckii]
MAEPLNSRSGVQRLAERLEKPLVDDRTYRVVKLPNDLEALLIHDPETDKAAAAMDVNVGAFADAEDMPGMAHAVEHLLFMGTEKYPGENDYNSYLTKYGGYSNAFTASTSTNYYFELSASSTKSATSSANTSKESLSVPKEQAPLYGGLDRFAQFFIKPLFLEDTLDRELKAVDSENKKNLQSDNWRLNQLNKSLSSKKHPFHTFSTGNYKLLHDDPIARGIKIRDEFIGFYEKNYSANRMKLAVLGRESLDELESWVTELFSDVKNQKLPQMRWDGIPILGAEEVQTQIFTKPVMDQRNLDIYFGYPDEEDAWDSKPGRYLSHLIGHEGPGSILAYLKSKGWANALSAGASPVCPGTGMFMLQVRLTEEGLKQYKEIVKTVFQYINIIREAGPQKWIFDEEAQLSEIDFRFMQKSPASRTVSHYSGTMQRPLPRDKLLSGQALIRKFSPEGIERALADLVPENFRIVLISKELPVQPDSKEKWYGTEYKYEKIPGDFMDEIKKAAKATEAERPAELHLPVKNEFIPQRLDVDKKDVVEPAIAPKLIRHDATVRTWYKKDDRFWVPKANVHVWLRSPIANLTPLTAVLSQLYQELVRDSLDEYSYAAELAGIAYAIVNHAQGLDVVVVGYNDKMSVLLEKVLVSMRDLVVKPERFDVVKERVTRGFKNFDYTEPFRQISTYSRWITSQRSWANHELLQEIGAVTAEDVQAFFPQMLKQMHIEILAHGNLYKEDALQMTDLVQSTLKPRTLPQSQWQIRRSVVLPEGADYRYERTLANPDNINHAIDYIIYVGWNVDRSTRAKILLLGDLTSEPVFDQLRTKEQLGYVVSSAPLLYSSVAAWRVVIQSERDCHYLEQRIDAFLNDFETMLKDMPDDEFEAQKIGLINKRLEKLKNLDSESNRFWHHITNETYDFELVYRDVENIEPLTKEDMLAFYRSACLPSSPSRIKTSTHLNAQASAESIAAKVDPAEQKRKLADTLAQVFTQLGVDTDVDTLMKRFDAVDINAGDQKSILDAAAAYLKENAKIAAETVEQIVQQGPSLLEQILPSLGIRSTPAPVEVNGEAGSVDAPANDSAKDEQKSETVVIDDVQAFKASLPLSAAPKPVKDLIEFEETEPKL